MECSDELKTALNCSEEGGRQHVVRCSHCFSAIQVSEVVRTPGLEGIVKKKFHRGRRGGRKHHKGSATQHSATKHTAEPQRPARAPEAPGSEEEQHTEDGDHDTDGDVELVNELSSLNLATNEAGIKVKQEVLDEGGH